MSQQFKAMLVALIVMLNLSTGPTKVYGIYTSVKSSGMGGAVCAHPIDTLVAAYNPAGLAFVGDRWDLGVHWANQWGEARYKGNLLIDGPQDSHNTCHDLFVPEFGVSKWTAQGQFTWGFVTYNRTFYKTSFKYPNPMFGTSKPELEYLHYVAAPTGTLCFGCNHAIGVTIDFHGQRLKVNGLENFERRRLSRHPHDVTNNGYDYSGGIGVTIGWMSRASDCVSIGVAYSPMVIMSHLEDYQGLVPRDGRINIPQRIVGGVAIEMLCDFTVTFDIEHTKYNEVSALAHSFFLPPHKPHHHHHHSSHHSSHREHRKHRDRALHELGGDQGPALGWMDQTAFRFGLDWKINDEFDMRAGYVYHRHPVRNSQTLPNTLVPNIIEQVVTWGGSWRLDGCNEFSFYGAYEFYNEIHGRHSIPAILGGGEVNLKEKHWVTGISWGRFF